MPLLRENSMPECLENIITWIPFILGMCIWLWFAVQQFKKSKNTLLVCFFVFLSWNFYRIYDEIKPPVAYADSLMTFVNSIEDTSWYRINHIHIDGNEYFELSGPCKLRTRIKSIMLARSGPPGYMFNSTGDLIDWIYDIDDAPQRWVGKWGYLTKHQRIEQEISFEDALARIYGKSEESPR